MKTMEAEITDVPDSTFKKVLFPDYKKQFVNSVNFKKNYSYDATIICKDGHRIKTHKTLLALSSVFLKECLLASESTREPMCFITLPDVKSYDLQMLLKLLTEGFLVGSPINLSSLKELMTFLSINFLKRKNINNRPMSSTRGGTEPDTSSQVAHSRPCEVYTSVDPLYMPSEHINNSLPTCTKSTSNLNGIPEIERVFLPPGLNIVNIPAKIGDRTQSVSRSHSAVDKSHFHGNSLNVDEQSSVSEVVNDTLEEDSSSGVHVINKSENDKNLEPPITLAEQRPLEKSRNRVLLKALYKRPDNSEEISLLEKFYQQSPYASPEAYNILQKKLGLSRATISSWFYRRRNGYKIQPQWIRASRKRTFRKKETQVYKMKKLGLPQTALSKQFWRQQKGLNKENAQKILSHSTVVAPPVCKVIIERMPEIEDLIQRDVVQISDQHLSKQKDVTKQSVTSVGNGPFSTKERLSYLEKIFKRNKFPSADSYTNLERKLSASRRYLQSWFCKRRMKERRDRRRIRNNGTTVKSSSSDKSTVHVKTTSNERLGSVRRIRQGLIRKCNSSSYQLHNKLRPKINNDNKPISYHRTLLLESEKEILEKIYRKTPYPGSEVITKLQQEFKVSRKAVNRWFSHRRHKARGQIRKCNSSSYQLHNKLRPKVNVDNKPVSYHRTLLHESEKGTLEKIYRKTPYPGSEVITKLQQEFKVSRKALNRWFSHRRHKARVNKKKRENELASKISSKYKNNLLSKKEKDLLEELYRKDNSPTIYDRRRIALNIGVTEKAVSRWFNQKRSDDIAGIFRPNKLTGAERRKRYTLSTPTNEQSENLDKTVSESGDEEQPEEKNSSEAEGNDDLECDNNLTQNEGNGLEPKKDCSQLEGDDASHDEDLEASRKDGSEPKNDVQPSKDDLELRSKDSSEITDTEKSVVEEDNLQPNKKVSLQPDERNDAQPHTNNSM